MELVREDGSVIELKEGERRELGRGSPFDAKWDKSVSRIHVIVELLRPASRKGKEVVGKNTALKLHVQVVGRNPICISTSQVAEDNNSPQIKFAEKGETNWLDPGDKFALSIRQPLFFVLRQCSRGGLGGDGMVESNSAGRLTKPVENSLKSMAEKNVVDQESNSLEEEEGIARAVARLQRRRLERDMEQQRMRLSEQRQSQNNDALDNSEQVEPGAESHEEPSVAPRAANVLGRVDPVSEFGFIVKGSEFQAYEKRSKTENGLLWDWKIDKKGEIGEDSVEGKSKINKGNSVKISRSEKEDDDEEWGGDNNEEKEKLSKAIGSKARSKVSTRSSRSTSADQKRKIPQTLNPRLLNPSGRVSQGGEDLSDFLVDDDDSIEEEGEDEYEDEAEWMDDDETVSHQTERRVINREKHKPACKYGSNCYRTNKEHLSQFSHPQR